MKVLIDTNIILDVLLERAPWAKEAAELWKKCQLGEITGCCTASTITDIFYIARRLTDSSRARTAVQLCLHTFEICPIDRSALELADQMAGLDFEDNVQIASATLSKCTYIVTRDPKDFQGSPIPAVTVEALLARIVQGQ